VICSLRLVFVAASFQHVHFHFGFFTCKMKCASCAVDVAFLVLTSLGYLLDPNVATKTIPIIYLICRVAFDCTFETTYPMYILMGLMLSTAGDVSLIYQHVDPMWCLNGLAFFLLAHISYIISYLSNGAKIAFSTDAVKVMVAFFSVMMFILLPALPRDDKILFGAVIVYGITISTMGLLALNKFIEDRKSWPKAATTEASRAALIGSILFIISDTTLAINKFKAPVSHAEEIIMLTYYFGQALIAKSAAR
jgi:uncharacterized membrane protein YhhN